MLIIDKSDQTHRTYYIPLHLHKNRILQKSLHCNFTFYWVCVTQEVILKSFLLLTKNLVIFQMINILINIDKILAKWRKLGICFQKSTPRRLGNSGYILYRKKKKIHSLKAKGHKKTDTSLTSFVPYISLVISCYITNHPKT